MPMTADTTLLLASAALQVRLPALGLGRRARPAAARGPVSLPRVPVRADRQSIGLVSHHGYAKCDDDGDDDVDDDAEGDDAVMMLMIMLLMMMMMIRC